MWSYPVIFTPDKKTCGYVITFPDLPFGVTQGDTVEEAKEMALDAILTVLDVLMGEKKTLPKPGKRKGKNVRYVTLNALQATKAALYTAWLQSGISKTEFASRLKIQKTNVDRLFDLWHSSRLEQLEAAFRVLGKSLDIEVRDAA